MELESGAEDPGVVTEMFRAAHTLKGGAAVVGFADVAAVVHELEQILEELRSGTRRADAALVDGVLVTVDAVREMVDRAMVGAEAGGAAATARAAIAAARGGRRTARPGEGNDVEAADSAGIEEVGTAREAPDADRAAAPATEEAAQAPARSEPAANASSSAPPVEPAAHAP